MDLYIIRHGDALGVGVEGITDDASRPLSEEGQKQAKLLGKKFLDLGIRPAIVLTSPLLRARQTAEGMLRQWHQPLPELMTCEELAPGGKPRKLARFLASRAEKQIALVGHEPDLSTYAAWFIGSKKAQINLAKAGVAFVICDDDLKKGSGCLQWLVTPEWLGA